MAELTKRDLAWLAVHEAFRNDESVTSSDVMERTGVSRDVARGVLLSAEKAGLCSRESEHAHTFEPTGTHSIEDILGGLDKKGDCPQAIDLFCGTGGLSRGFEYADISVLAAFDWKDIAIETYNHIRVDDHVHVEDLYHLTPAEASERYGISPSDVDIIAAVPPVSRLVLWVTATRTTREIT